jgi:DNA-binding transcriptional LysR family regulator
VLDPVTLDQLRTFVVVVREGNFSAAARKLRRVQSAVSTSMANLEAQLGLTLWDRTSKIAKLTEEGHAVLARAQRVVAEMDALRAFTSDLAQGVEAKISLCVDALFPVESLVEACAEFTARYPSVDLRVDTQTMSAVSDRVASGRATLGIVTPLGVRPGLEGRALTAAIRMLPVVAKGHPLAAMRASIPTSRLAEHIQIVLSEREREGDDGVPDQAVLSTRTWRVADLATKHAMLRRGLGWGNLPEHIAGKDLARGRLVRLRVEAWAEDEHTLHFHALHRTDRTLGPAHTWLLETLEKRCLEQLAPA